jgi:hypothetical protein
MLPETHWNSPYQLIEETRKEQQLRNFIPLSELWNSPVDATAIITAEASWNRLFDLQDQSLIKAIENSSASATYFNQLQSACWQYGKSLAEKEWSEANVHHPYDGFLAISSLKIGQLKHTDPFILERKTANQCSFYWLGAPVDHPQLSTLYHEVLRGFCYHLSRHLRLEIHAGILPGGDEKIKTWKISLLWIG